MTEPAQVRLKIDPELHNEFKAACVRSGVSMADQAARMITQFVTGPGGENDDVADPNGGGIGPGGDGVTDERNAAAASIETLIDARLQPVLETLEKAATRGHINWLYEQQGKDTDRRNDALAKSITGIGDKVAAEIASSHARWQSKLIVRRRDRTWLGCSAVAGMAALTLLLMLVSGTGIGRTLAVKLAGGETRWHAALLLAGNGSMLAGDMIAETDALLADPTFRELYVACVERAKRAKSPFKCTLPMSPLRRAR